MLVVGHQWHVQQILLQHTAAANHPIIIIMLPIKP
jgi:hypothetical protein